MSGTVPAIYALPSQEPGLVWYEYAQAVGAEELKASFGWEYPPPGARAEEFVWRVFDASHQRWQVGWLSLRVDPCDPYLAYLCRGIVPSARRQGYRVAMGDLASQIAKAMGMKWLAIEILDTNPEHLKRVAFEWGRGGPWEYAGKRALPPPTVFTFVRDLKGVV